MHTIFALATARGKSGVAVIRISGPQAFAVCHALAGTVPEPGCFSYCAIRSAKGALLDRGLVLAFRGPRSFTGEDVVELQLHGSIAVIQSVERAIYETGLARQAEAGEFTRRALANERMDISQVEALGDLIEAETEQQRLQAQAAFEGGLREVADQLRLDLLKALALVEVTIDFADEDVPVDVSPDVADCVDRVIQQLSSEIDGSFVSERLRDGFEVAIVGPPNAGKSTLLNRIAQRDVAITSEVAGTTRDVLEVNVDLQGIPVLFLDTAGLRTGGDVVERIGIDRARQRAQTADLRVFLRLDAEEDLGIKHHPGDYVARAKADLAPGAAGVSGLTGQGVAEMLAHVSGVLETRLSKRGAASRERHRQAMMGALVELRKVRAMLDGSDHETELVAEHLRYAVRCLDSLVGAIDVESVLGAIFSKFCIGK
jgi:tRNA modification GTPase